MKWLNEHEADYDECELLWYLLHQALHANNQRKMGAELRRLYDGNQTRCNMYDQENMILTQNLGKWVQTQVSAQGWSKKRSTRRQNELRLVLKQKTGIEVGKGVVYWLIDNSDL